MSFPIRPNVPPLLQCYKCQGYEHIAVVCKGKQRCAGDDKFEDCGDNVQIKGGLATYWVLTSSCFSFVCIKIILPFLVITTWPLCMLIWNVGIIWWQCLSPWVKSTCAIKRTIGWVHLFNTSQPWFADSYNNICSSSSEHWYRWLWLVQFYSAKQITLHISLYVSIIFHIFSIY